MASRLITVPFNAGQNEGVDRTSLDPAELRALYDGRLTRDGRIEVRPSYAALSSSTVRGLGLNAYDLCSYQNNLVALGAHAAGISDASPGQPFTYIGGQGWAAQSNTFFHMLSMVTDLEILYQAPYGNVLSNSDVAYSNGFLCICTTDSDTTACSVYVMQVSTRTIVAQARFTGLVSARCVAVGNTLLVVTRDSANSFTGYKLDTTALASGFTVGNTFITAVLGDSFGWDLVGIPGTSDWLISFSNSGDSTMRLRRYNLAFAATFATSVAARNGNSCVVSDGTSVVWCFTNGNNVEMRTLGINITAGVTVGPTTVLGPGAAAPTPIILGSPSVHIEGRGVGALAVTIQASSAATLGIDASNYATFTYATVHTRLNNGSADNVRIASKVVAAPVDSTTNTGIGLGALIVGGNTSGTDQVYATCLQGIEEPQHCAARWNYGVADKFDTPRSSSNKHGRSSIASDGAGLYWAIASVVDDSGVGTANRGTLQIVQFRAASAARRQCAEMQGGLYISGGFTYYYDRGTVAAESGFLDTPVIVSNTQGAAGALTLLGVYKYVVTYEWQDTQGRLHRSTPSTPFNVTMTGANNSNTLTVSSPRSLRRALFVGDANGVKIVAYRAGPSDSIFFRVSETTAGSSASYAATQTLADALSDVVAQTRPVLYTLSQKPIANVAMQPCKYLAAGKDRMIFGGLPDPYLVQLSQLAFPGEPIENASPNNFAFQARLPERVTGVACPGDSYVAFTEAGIYQIPGEGPQRNGTGEFFTPRPIFTDGGCIDFRSIVDTARGTFFQLAADKLYLLDLNGTATWVGQPVRDTLELYPTIVGAVLCQSTQRVAFACVNLAANDSQILIYDLRRGIWTVDRPGFVLRSIGTYLGRLALVDTTGLVYLENAATGSGVGVLPTLSIRSGDYAPFAALGLGDIVRIAAQCTFVGNCSVQGFISYDDGKTWTSMGTQTVTSANTKLGNPVSGAALAADDPVTLIFTPHRRTADRFSVRLDVTNSTDTGGVRVHMLSLEVQAQEFTTRKAAGNLL